MTFEPSVSPSGTNAVVPGLAVLFPGFAVGTASVNVYRISGGRTMLVRGGVNVSVAGGLGIVDVEAPGIGCSYFAQMLDASGNTIGYTGSNGTTLDLGTSWIHNPFDPAHGVSCQVAAATGAQVAGQIPISTYYPIGRAAGVAISGPRRGIGNVQLVVYGTTLAQADALDAMFGPISGDLGLPPFLCVRFASKLTKRIRLPQPLFIAVPAPTQTPVNLLAGGTRIGWDLSGSEVDPPAAALAQTLLRRADINARYATRADLNAAYATRSAANTDYNLAGYAG